MKTTSKLRFIASCIIIVLMNLNTFGQITLTVTPPASGAGACKDNLYRLIIANTGGNQDTLTLSGSYSAVGSANCATTTRGIDFRVDTLGTVIHQGDTLRLTIGSGVTDTVFYHAYIDCHVIQDSAASATVNFLQQFSSKTTVNLQSIFTHTTSNITYPFILELQPGKNMNGYYLTESDFTFMYTNTTAAPARMRFFFHSDTSNYCHQLTTDSILFQKGINGAVTLHNSVLGDTITLQQHDTLLIRQQVTINSCINTCSKDTAVFRWVCNYPAPVTTNFCSSCQNEYLHVYDVNKDLIPNVDVVRILPADAIYDNACMNDTIGMTTWSYRIINTGKEAIDTLRFNLLQNTNLLNSVQDENLRFLSLVPISSLQINKNGSFSGVDTVLIPRVHYLCTDLVTDALHRMDVTVKDFLTTDTLYVSFKTFRCSDENSALFNANKNYNQWGFDSLTVVNKCGITKKITSTTGLMPGTTYISGQTIGLGYDVNLKTTFLPTISDLNVTGGVGEHAQFHVDLKSLLNPGKPHVYQLLGCNEANADCDTLLGWMRAKLHTKTNLILLHPSLDAFIRKINPLTGDTVVKMASWWHSTADTSTCTNRDYFYYFNLNDSAMRSFLDSGQFVFTLTACCATDTSPTPYFVEFNLLAQPDSNCFTTLIPSQHDTALIISDPKQKWLPLSAEDNDISVHCPGCKAPGIIVDNYQLRRTTLGLQDSDDDGRADSATAIIDPTGAWYASHKEQLGLDFSAYNDRLEDVLVSHLQPGDPTDGGYSYVQMQDTLLNLRFNVLQLSRRIPLGLQTMYLTPDTLEFYIDDTVNTVNGCFECASYGLAANNYTTQLKIRVTGSDIFTHFLDTLINGNEYMYRFVDTTGGNLSDTTFHQVIPGGNTFNGFFEGQYYRMRVTYRVCGNFTGNGVDFDTHVKESKIRNLMWMSGKVQTTSAIPQMLNDTILLHDSLWTILPSEVALGYNLMDTSYTNNHLFFCETRGSIHYFVSSDRFNASSVINDPGCEKTMTAIATTKIAGGKVVFDAYPYEYRPPLLGADSVFVQVPAGYYLSRASIKNKIVFGGFEYNTDTTGIPLTDTTGQILFVMDDLPALNCLTQSDTPSVAGKTMWYGDQLNSRIIDMKLLPLECNTANITPPDSTILIRFDRQSISCMTTAGCSLEGATPIKQAGNSNQELIINPGLNLSSTASYVTALKDTVCWNFTLSNLTTGSTQADHVFIAVPPGVIHNFLTHWYFLPSDSSLIPYLNDTIIPVIESLPHGGIVTGNLCAVITDCPTAGDTLNFNIHYGWNCDGWPQLPYDSSAVCGYNSFEIGIVPAGATLTSPDGKTYETPYVLCDTIALTTCFENNDIGYVYPHQLLLTNIHQGVTILNGTIHNSQSTFPLSGISGDSLWGISDSGLYVLYPQNGGFNSQDDPFCITMNLLLDCAFAGDSILPDKQLIATSFCGDTISAFVDYTVDPAFVMNMTTSLCQACFTITKTAEDTIAYTGSPFTYYLHACNFSSDTNTVVLNDLPPPGFTLSTTLPFTVTLPPMACDSFAVTGTFTAGGICPTTTNTALLTHSGDTLTADACVPVIDVCANTQLTFADSTFSGHHVYNNTSILIEGRFYVDDSLTLNNCMVYVNPGGQITILTSGTLITNNTTIQSCDTMWQGITVGQDSRLLVLNNSFIRDANTAITALNNSVITVDSSSIFDCVRGFYNAPISSGFLNITLNFSRSVVTMTLPILKPDYIGQPAHGSLPFAGLEINNLIMTLGGNTGRTNEFYKLNNGLVAHNSIVKVKRSRFYNITRDAFYSGIYNGSAMAADATTTTLAKLTVLPEAFSYNTVNQAEYGIYTKGVSLFANYLHLLNVRYGAYCTQTPGNKSSSVSNCAITSRHIGIAFIANPWAKYMICNLNSITINGTSGSGFTRAHCGIWMSETNANTAVRYLCDGNNITLNNAQNGIYSGVLNTAKIKFNIIKINDNANNSGISVWANRYSSISCNSVTGSYSSGATGNTNGISVGNNSLVGSNTLYCNSVDSTYRGFYFGGQNPSTVFKGNEMNNRWVGLYLNTGAPVNPTYIGTQPHFGNKWNIPSLSGFGGVNLTPPQYILASRFDVNQNLGTNYNPVVTPSTWFNSDTSGTTYYCNTSLVCSNPPPSLPDTAITRLIAEGVFDSEETSEEARALAEEYLYSELADDSSLWESDSAYIAFMIENQGEPVSYLYSVDEYMRAAYNYDTTLMALVDSLDILIASFTDSIENRDQWRENNPELDVDSMVTVWTDRVNFLNQTATNINLQREGIISNNLENAELQNDYVVGDIVPYSNNSYINEREIAFLESGNNLEEVSNYYSEIFSIAQQCPYTGGQAVERARTLIALVNDSVFYDDVNTCLQVGVYRQQNSDLITTVTSNSILINPNPAKEKIEIKLKGDFKGLCKVEISNMMNELVIQQGMNCEEKTTTIDVSTLSQGIYTVKASVDKQFYISKLSIIK